MGEADKDVLRVGFDRAVKLAFHGATVSSDAGLFPYRDLDEAAGLTASGAADLFDQRSGSNIRHRMVALLRQSVYSRLAGYDDVNDAERLSVDPVMRRVVGGRAAGAKAASTSQVGRFETEVMTRPENLAALMTMPGQWVDLIRRRRPINKLVLDMDSSVSETYGELEGTAYNGHFGCPDVHRDYHPLFIFDQDGDVERALLREMEPLLTRPVGRPSNKPIVWYHDFLYQAGTWDSPRRVVAKIEWHQGPDVRRDSPAWASS